MKVNKADEEARQDFDSLLLDHGGEMPDLLMLQFKGCAKSLHVNLKPSTPDLKLSRVHEAMARALGFANFHATQVVVEKVQEELVRLDAKGRSAWLESHSTLIDSLLPLFHLMRDVERFFAVQGLPAERLQFLTLLSEHLAIDIELIAPAYRDSMHEGLTEWLPPPVALKYAVPLARVDVEGGGLDEMVDVLVSRQAFKGKPLTAVKSLLAIGLGYASWDKMVSRDADLIAGIKQLPNKEYELEACIAWRIFLASGIPLTDVCAAVCAAWMFSRLSVRHLYAMQQLRMRDGLSSVGFREKRLPGYQLEKWMRGFDSSLDAKGKVLTPYRAEIAFDTAHLCWSEASGIDPYDLIKRIRSEVAVDVEEAILFSWASQTWPLGLTPVQYMGPDGQLFGYSWYWRELGVYHAHVFKSPDDFLKSAQALWHRKPTFPFRCTDLPPLLSEVEFINPWDGRTRRLSGFPDPTDPDCDLAGMGEVERFNQREPDDDVYQVIKSRGGLLHSQRALTIDGEPWTASNPEVDWDKLDGLLGLRLTPMNELDDPESWEWLKPKIPFALSQREYEGLCGFTDAMSRLRETAMHDRETLRTEIEPDVVQMFSETATVAKPRPSEAFEIIVYHSPTMESAAVWEGESALSVYPELGGLDKVMLGDYALAYYGKNSHTPGHGDERDPLFMAYCILRNLGLDPHTSSGSNGWMGLLVLLRSHWLKNPGCFKAGQGLQTLSERIFLLGRAMGSTQDRYENLDSSLDKSRLEFIGLKAASE